LGKNQIYSALDPTPVLYFLNSDIVHLPRDEKLVAALYRHLDNIRMIKRAPGIIDMRSAGFTSVHQKNKEALEEGLKTAIAGCQADLDLCLKKLQQ